MSLANYQQVWCVAVAGVAPPGPPCLVARELRSGRLVRLRGDELASLREAPFSTEDSSLFVAYGAAEVLSVFHTHSWAAPRRTLDLFFEFRAATNGLATQKGTGLLGALAHHGLPLLPASRSLAGGDDLGGCEAVAEALGGLLRAMLPNIDVPGALLRGRYAWAVAAMQHRGIPIDVPAYDHIRQIWPATRAQLIADVDERYGVYDGGTFRRDRFARFLTDRGIPWPRLRSGELDCSADTFRIQAQAHTAVVELHELRASLSQMQLFDRLAIGPDGRNRTDLKPFASETGRNQPSSAEYIFGPSRWIRSLIRPEPGMAVAYLDFISQEIAVAGALSGDAEMLEAYSSGDFYLAFAQRAGAAPADATKTSHTDVRAVFKAVALGVMYGMGAKSLAKQIGRPRAVAEDLLAQHKRAFPKFWAWSKTVVDDALLTGKVATVLGWPRHLPTTSGGPINTRSIANFPIQANAAEMLRLACCLLVERGIGVCGPVHDAVLIEATEDEIGDVVSEARKSMEEASAAVLGGFAVGVDAKIVRHPDRFMGDVGASVPAQISRVLKNLGSAAWAAPLQPRRIGPASRGSARSPVVSDGPTGPTFQRPLRPSVVVPRFLHRGSDGWVPLARRVGEQWQEVGSVPANQLSGLFADEILADALRTDSYFGLHSMYRPGHYRTKHTLAGLQPPLRNVDSVRYLNCCHVDLDGYKHGLDSHGMIAAVMRLVDDGTLPPPSLFTLSRGVWVFWRLHDRMSVDAPLRAYPESVMTRWCRIQGALTRVCASIGGDAAARHAATLTRIPGSVNTKNGRAVGYMLPADIQGKPFSYTLEEMEDALRPHFPSVQFPSVVDAVRAKPANPTLSKRGLQGWRGRWDRLLQALGQLRDLRGGWKVGVRSTAIFYVAVALRGLRAHSEQVQVVMAQHLAWMEQPAGDTLKLFKAIGIFRAVARIRGRGASLQAVADALDVSPDEAALLSEGKRKPFPPASRHRPLGLPEPAAVPQAVAKAHRLAAVRRICDTLWAQGVAPDGAVVEAHLAAQGLKAARATVLSDMRAIGCPSRRALRPKPSAQAGVVSLQASLFTSGRL